MDFLSPQELEYFKSLPGETIGSGLLEDKKFILEKMGQAGLEKIDAELKKIGCAQFSEMKSGEWYPVGCNLASYLLMKKMFNWDDKILKEMGKNSPKISVLMRTMTKHFISPRRMIDSAPYYWKKFYTVGELEVTEFNEEKKYCYVQLNNFPGHETFCRHLEGVFEEVTSFSGVTGVNCQEEKCRLKKEGEAHLFKLTWEKI